jgi:hypothetical protein
LQTYNPDVIIGTGSWLSEEVSNAEICKNDYTTFRRERNVQGGGVLSVQNNYIACLELWADENFEMIAVEVKDRDTKFTCEIVGIYRTLNKDMRVVERLATQTNSLGNSTRRSIIGVDLNLPYVDWNVNTGM